MNKRLIIETIAKLDKEGREEQATAIQELLDIAELSEHNNKTINRLRKLFEDFENEKH